MTSWPKSLTGLMEYSYRQVSTSFPEANLERTLRLSVLGVISGCLTDREIISGCARVRTNVQKRLVLVCEGSLCTRKLPDVSGLGLG